MFAAVARESVEAMRARLDALWDTVGRAGPPTPEMRELAAQIVRRQPDAAWPRLSLAEVLEADGAADEAARMIEAAVALEPDDSDVALSAAEQLVTLGRLDEALTHLRRVPQELAAPDDRVRFGRRSGIEGRVQELRGDLESAEELLTRAVDVLPEYDYHWYCLGAFLLDRGEIDRATAILRRGLDLFPNDEALLALREDLGRREAQHEARRATSSSTGARGHVTWRRYR